MTQVEGYTVLRACDRQETGLTITPAFKIEGNGQVQVNRKSWFVNYSRVGQPVGGPFRTRQEAEGLASELARFDWNRARAFLVTAEEGSFSAAARALGTTQPTIGRQVAQLEEELGVGSARVRPPRLPLEDDARSAISALVAHARRTNPF